jgi:DNA polymerase-4
MQKPDAITGITPENYREKVWPLPASELIYIGPATERKLTSYGVHTIGDVAALGPETLKSWFGINGVKLWTYANGTDTSRIMQKDFVSPIKSVGHGITCTADLNNEEEVYKVILELSQDVGHRLRVHDLAATGVQLWVRASDLSPNQFQFKLPCRTQIPSEIANAAFRLFKERYQWKITVRAITVRAIDLVPQTSPEQISLFVNYPRHDKLGRVQDAIEEIRRRFGEKAIYNAILMGDKKMPSDKRDLVRMPGLMYQ